MSHGEESTKVVIKCKFLLLVRSFFRASLLRAGVFKAGISFCIPCGFWRLTCRVILREPMQVTLRAAGVNILQDMMVCPKGVPQRYQDEVQLWRFTYKQEMLRNNSNVATK